MGCVCVGWGLLKKHRRNWQQNNNNNVNSVEACCDFLGLLEEDIPRGYSGKCIMTLLSSVEVCSILSLLFLKNL